MRRGQGLLLLSRPTYFLTPISFPATKPLYHFIAAAAILEERRKFTDAGEQPTNGGW